jgi:hypothetical protein
MRVHEPGYEMDQYDDCRDKEDDQSGVGIMDEAKCLFYKGHGDRHVDKVDGLTGVLYRLIYMQRFANRGVSRRRTYGS